MTTYRILNAYLQYLKCLLALFYMLLTEMKASKRFNNEKQNEKYK